MKCEYCGAETRSEEEIKFCCKCGKKFVKNEVHKSCPFWDKDFDCCGLLKEDLCRTGECGFYPPTAELRKLKIRRARLANL